MKDKYKDAQSALLDVAIRHLGGLTPVSKIFDDNISRQAVFIWIKLGRMPLCRALRIEKKFKIPAIALSWKEHNISTGSNVSWEKAVRSCKFLSPSLKQQILKMKEPVK